MTRTTRAATLRGMLVGVTGSVTLAAFAACAEFGANEPPPPITESGADTAAPVTPDSSVTPDASDAGSDGPTPGDSTVAPLLAETFDNGCGTWPASGTTTTPEPNPRTNGACRVCPDPSAALLRGTFTARRGIVGFSAWVRTTTAEGQGLPFGSVTVKLSIPQASGSPKEGTEMVSAAAGAWTELPLTVLSTDSDLSAAATVTISTSNLGACLSVDDLVIR